MTIAGDGNEPATTGHRIQAGTDEPSPDERAGMAWWNELSEVARGYWMRQAGDTGRAADAWAAFQMATSAVHHAEVDQDPCDR